MTYARVAKMTAVQTIIVNAALQSWSLHQMDVKNVFVYDDLKDVSRSKNRCDDTHVIPPIQVSLKLKH